MRKIFTLSLLALAALPYQSSAYDSFKLTGYARYGMGYTESDPLWNNSIMNGINVIKTAGSYYALTGHLANQGMGMELGLQKSWAVNDSQWRALFMVTDKYNASPWETAQIFAGGSNVIESNPTAEIWAGQRYAQRVQMLLNNYKPLINDGVGGGIKNYDVGFGKVSVEAISGLRQNGYPSDSNGRYALMTSLKDIIITDNHTLDFYANYGFGDGRERNWGTVDDGSAYQVAGMYNLNRKGSFTKFMVRYGNRVKENIVRHAGPAEDGGSLGIFLYGHEKLTDKFAMMYAFSHENSDLSTNWSGDKEKWYQGVLRGGYYYNKHHSTWLETAYDTIDFLDDTNSSWKVTLSQNVSLADYLFARPIVHFYVSYGGLDTELVRNSGAKKGVNEAVSVGTYFEVFL